MSTFTCTDTDRESRGLSKMKLILDAEMVLIVLSQIISSNRILNFVLEAKIIVIITVLDRGAEARWLVG